MIKEFDLNIGDVVWFMWKNKPTKGRISKIWSNTFISPVDCDSIEESVWYYIIIDKRVESFRREILYPSKEELKKSL
jgi:hypothetical protein